MKCCLGMPMNPELLSRTSPFDPGMLRELHVVDLEELKRASDAGALRS